MPPAPRFELPLKMTSSIFWPRSARADCSPRTHWIASAMFDFPQPFGPTTAVMPLGKSTTVLSGKLLKPDTSMRSSRSIGRCSSVGERAGAGESTVPPEAEPGV